MPPFQPAGRTHNPATDDVSSVSSGSDQENEEPRTWWAVISGSLNFYRIHLLFFTFTPIIASAIFYASNGEIHIAYIDCLYNCVSAMTVCGLATSNLSTLTGWQQTILFILMLCGSPVSVSVVMIAVRRHFFQTKFKHIIAEQRQRRRSLESQNGIRRRFSFLSGPRSTNQTACNYISDEGKDHAQPSSLLDRFKHLFSSSSAGSTNSSDSFEREEYRARMQLENKDRKQREKDEKRIEKEKERLGRERQAAGGGGINTSMIRRIDGDVPMLINPSGQMGAIQREQSRIQEERDERENEARRRRLSDAAREEKHVGQRTESPVEVESLSGKGSSGEDVKSRDGHIEEQNGPLRPSDPLAWDPFPRSKTIAFDPTQVNPPHQHQSTASQVKHFPRTATIEFGGTTGGREDMGNGGTLGRRVNAGGYGGPTFEKSATRRSEAAGTIRAPSMFPRSTTGRTTVARSTKHSGFGGFPMPHEIIRQGMAYFFPKIERRITRTLTMPQTVTFASARSGTGSIGPGKPVPYISFDAVVGRNSQFKDLSTEQLEELGGVEYRALKVLMWIIPCYLLFIQLSGWIIFWPYIGAKGRYDDVFESQSRVVPIGWFAIFQSVSAFSNTGMSLVDQSMIPFQTAYLMIIYLIFLILAGNTAYPIFLRFTIWAISKMVPMSSRLHETCRFLLDHPRRCYIYLFPSHQTMFLLMIIVIMSVTDWVSFLVLDIGTPAIEEIPVGTRIVAGWLQSAAVRAAGFAIVPLAELAPAVKVLYTIMMYVSVYPIAMSVRATNVYEERSLGLFDDQEEGQEDEEAAFGKDPSENKMVGWTRYLAFHARRQLAFDIWWLGLALWLVCIIERAAINNKDNESYFNIFAILFELVSAYGTVGLSLGVSYDNYSLSGGFRPLAKLVVCAVMIRGRHRGLPVAIDRAVMLPNELLQEDKEVMEEDRLRRRRSSLLSMREDSYPPTSNPDHHHRRDSSLSTSDRLRPTQPFFPSHHNNTNDQDGSAIADDEDNVPPAPTSPKHHQNSYPPPAHSHDFANNGFGGHGGGAAGGALTPVREATTQSRAPSPTEGGGIDVGDLVERARRGREEEGEVEGRS